MLLLLASGAACSLVFAYQPAAEKTHRTAAIPAAIGAWSGTDLPIGKRVYELLETEDILMRRYRRPADRAGVDLYVVHAADSRKVAHPPEICFSGGGYAAPEKGERAIAGPRGPIPAIRMLLAHEGGETLLVYYWYRLDGRDTASYLGHQLETVFRQIRRERHEGSMVRLSTPVGPDGVAGAEARIAAFGREALGKVLEAIP
jgi:EpsI family protein